jgi:restriction system protein
VRYKKKKTSLLEQIFNSDWKFSAVLAVIVFAFSFVLLPLLGLSNIFVKAFMPFIQSLSVLAIVFLSMVALVKVLVAIILKNKEKRSTDFLNPRLARFDDKNKDDKSFHRVTPIISHQEASSDAEKPIAKNINHPSTSTYKVEESKSYGYAPVVNPNLNQTNARVEPSIAEQKKAAYEVPKIEDVRDKWTLDFINSLEWKRFEDITSAYFHEIGIKNKQTGLGADGGIDLLLYETNAEQPSAIVQCKKWSNTVGIKLLREFLGVMSHQGVAKGYFFTTDKFNQEAINFAKEHNIELVDGKTLVVKLQRLSPESQYRVYTNITSGDYTTPTCVRCGSKMVLRKTDEKEFWGCRNYPKCRTVINIKTPPKPKPPRKFGSRLKKVR